MRRQSGEASFLPMPMPELGLGEMYDDFVGGVQFWGYALASGTGDGCVRMWDSESFFFFFGNYVWGKGLMLRSFK